jgi:transposase-like protein
MPGNTNALSLSDHWRQHIEDWSRSGLGQQAYCREQGLKYHQFHYWRKKLSRTSNQESPPRTTALVPVRYQPQSPVGDLSVHLPNGMSVRGIASDNLALVARLLETLR